MKTGPTDTNTTQGLIDILLLNLQCHLFLFITKTPNIVNLFSPQTAVQVQLKLEKNLRLCAENETNADCCPSPLCVLETLQVSACEGGKLQASLLVQVKIYGLLVPTVAGSGNCMNYCSSQSY